MFIVCIGHLSVSRQANILHLLYILHIYLIYLTFCFEFQSCLVRVTSVLHPRHLPCLSLAQMMASSASLSHKVWGGKNASVLWTGHQYMTLCSEAFPGDIWGVIKFILESSQNTREAPHPGKGPELIDLLRLLEETWVTQEQLHHPKLSPE